MDRPPPLNLIPFGNEWIVTNGELAADGTIRFPEGDAAEELFGEHGTPRVNAAPSDATSPRCISGRADLTKGPSHEP